MYEHGCPGLKREEGMPPFPQACLSFESGREGKKKLSKLAEQTKLPRQAGRGEDQAVVLGGVMFAELEAFAVEEGVPGVAAANGIECAGREPVALGDESK